MPVAYERDDARQLITVTVTEPYAVEDLRAVIDRQMAEGTWTYAMLYDLQAPMTVPADSRQVAAHVMAVGMGRERGPTGIIMTAQPEQFKRGLVYAELTRDVATIEILLTKAQLKDWLTRNTRRPQ